MNENNEMNPAGDPQADLVRDAMARFTAILTATAAHISAERDKLLADYDAEVLGKPETPMRSVAAALIVDASAGHVIDKMKGQAVSFFGARDRAEELLDDFLRDKAGELSKIKAKMAKKTAKGAAKKGAGNE